MATPQLRGNAYNALRQANANAKRTHKTLKREIPRAPENLRKMVGLGMPAPSVMKVKSAESIKQGLGGVLDAINQSTNCPVWNMDVIEQVRWNLQGPISDEAVEQSFSAEVDLFGSGRSVEGVDYVETTMRQTGQTQTYMVTCYIGFHLEPEPLCWTAQGNAWSHPASISQPPPSPDTFTQNDRFNGALGAAFAGDAPTQTYVQAVLEWGWWANYVAWHMARAYNLRWQIGQHTNIMDEVLRHTAYMPPSAQEGSASNSEVDIVDFVNRVNTRYDSLGSALDFLKLNFTRIGSVGEDVGEGVNLGLFRPDRSQQLVGATYGGMDLRSMLRGNSEFRKLALPYIIKPGIPIGLFLQENDSVQGNIMRRYLSITEGFGVTPPLITDDPNISGLTETGTDVMLERTVDSFNVPQQVDSDTAVFKGGELKISLMVKGFEVTEDWYNVLSSDPDVRNVVMAECGVRFAVQGASST